MRKLNVLLLLKRVDCNDGIASYMETVIGALREQGHRVVIASGPVSTVGAHGRYQALREGVLDWVNLDGKRLAVPNRRSLRRLSAVVRDYDVDVISPQGLAMLPIASLLGRLTGRAVVANYHPSVHGRDASAMARGPGFVSTWTHRATVGLFAADRYIALSTDIETFYRKVCAISARRVAYLPCAINTDGFWMPSDSERAAARARLDLAPETLVCVLPGRLNLNKGHDVAVAAVRHLRAARPDLRVVCLFPGAGDQQHEIEAHALQDDADARAFRFLGFVPDLLGVYWASDVVLLPSRREGFGTAVAEAMCAGCVPIRTPSGGARDQIIDGETGYIVPFDDPTALAQRIADLADPERRARLRQAASRHALSRFDKRSVVARTAELYGDAAAARKTRTSTILGSRSHDARPC